MALNLRSALAGAAAVGLVLAPATATNAQDSQIRASRVQVASPFNGAVTYSRVPVVAANAVSMRDAANQSVGRVVLHYGSGITLADSATRVLNRDGIPAVAYAGGNPGQVTVFINKKIYGHYTDDQIAGGELNYRTERDYKRASASLTPDGPALASNN